MCAASLSPFSAIIRMRANRPRRMETPDLGKKEQGRMPEESPSGGLDLLVSQYENMQSCIRCGLCLSVCPTYQISFAEEEGPRGRIAVARGLTEGHLTITPDLIEHQESCLLCEACTAV